MAHSVCVSMSTGHSRIESTKCVSSAAVHPIDRSALGACRAPLNIVGTSIILGIIIVIYLGTLIAGLCQYGIHTANDAIGHWTLMKHT